MGPELFDMHARVEQQHWWFAARRAIMRQLVTRVTPTGRAVVDIGCGTGANIAALAGPYVTIGVDTSAEAIRHSRARFPGVEFIEGTAEAVLPAIGTALGCVLLMDVLEHVPDDFRLLASVLAPLPVGSHALISVPADMRLWSGHDVAFQHYRRYDLARLEAVWSGQPVRVRLLSPFCSHLYWPIRIIRALRRQLRRPDAAPRSDLALPPRVVNAPLRRLFAAEGPVLARAIDTSARPFARGSSLIAILERTSGTVLQRGKPEAYAGDPHDPWPASAT